MIYLLALIVGVIVFFILVGILISAPVYKGPVTNHFNGKQFINPGNAKAKGFADVIRWMLNRQRGRWDVIADPNPGKKPLVIVKDNIVVTYINHSSFLIQTDGLNILLDPVYSERVSPFSWIGPKRMRPPGIRFEELPKIDSVIISHNHYDHLDMPTIRKLAAIHNPVFVVPLGVKAQFDKENFKSVTELDWWGNTTISASISIQSMPAQHFSGRGMLDRDKTLWCGYVIVSSAGSIYFAGDTGYNNQTFKEIGTRVGPFDISIIPIGAYKPKWFMSPIHCSPDEAVKIHLDTHSRQSIASHFGTFPLADDAQTEPVEELAAAIEKLGVRKSDFVVLPEGESFVLKN